jgi:hypothetical protein
MSRVTGIVILLTKCAEGHISRGFVSALLHAADDGDASVNFMIGRRAQRGYESVERGQNRDVLGDRALVFRPWWPWRT